MQRYAAPIPATEGVQFVLVAAVAGLAVLVDYLAVTEEMPGVAGLPLLAAFLTAAANGGSSLSPWFFVVGAGMWLVLVARQGRGRVQRWSTTVASLRTPISDTDVESQVMWGFGNVARQLGCRRRHRGGGPAGGHPAPADPVHPRRPGAGRRRHRPRRPGRVQLDGRPDPQPAERRQQHRHDLPDVGPVGSPAARGRGVELLRRRLDAPSVVAPTQQLNQSRVISSQVQVADRQLEVESNYLSSPNVASVAPVVATDFDGPPGTPTPPPETSTRRPDRTRTRSPTGRSTSRRSSCRRASLVPRAAGAPWTSRRRRRWMPRSRRG